MFCTIEPKSADQIFVRLSKMEKIDLLRASDDRVAYLADTAYKADLATEEVLLQVRGKVQDEFRTFDQSSYWTGAGIGA